MIEDAVGRRTVLAGLTGAAGLAAVGTSAGTGWLAQGAGTDPSGVPEGGPELDLTQFGVSSEAAPRENLARFNQAVARAPAGSTLVLPAAGRPYLIDTSGGWPRAVEIDRQLSIRLEGDLRASHSVSGPRPSFIFNVTAASVTIFGRGRLVGDGTINDVNAGTDETLPGLIRVAADDFSMSGVEIVDPPKVGLMLYQCRRARIVGARFTGGPRVYGDTGHFAIRAAGGGEHLFEANRFYPDASGGMAVQCIMLSGSNANLMVGNEAVHPYEKLIYGYGDRNIARGNLVTGNPGFIPGTNIQGTITAVIRFHGSHNRVESNRTRTCAGGVQMMDGTAHYVADNEFLDCGQSAITAYQSDLSRSVFRNNTGSRAPLVGFVAGDGIRLVSTAAARELVVESNRITGFSVGDPVADVAVWQGRHRYGRNSVVKPRIGNGRIYLAQRPGVSGDREPAWPSSPGASVRDGSLVWSAAAFEGGQAEIRLIGAGASAPISASRIANNATSGGRLGIVANHVVRSSLVGNRVEASEWGLVEEAGSGNRWQANSVSGAAPGRVRGLAPSSTQAR